MASFLSIIMGAAQLIAGLFMTLTGIGGGLGIKLILSGALSLVSTLFFSRTGREGWKSSARYGFDNLSNSGREGGPVPTIYGQEKYAPGFISINLKEEGGTEVLYLLALVSDGEIESITNGMLNDVPLTSFPGAEMAVRLGTATQTVIPGFNEIGAPYEAGTQLTLNATHVHSMKNTADGVTLAFVWPGGLYKTGDNGERSTDNVTVYVEYKSLTDTTYKPYNVPSGGQGFWVQKEKAHGWAMYANTGNTLRRKIQMKFDGLSGRPARGQYMIRVTGTINNDSKHVRVPTLATVIELINDERAYANLALVSVKLPASEQFSGQVPRFVVDVKGKKVKDPRTGLTAWSQNAALIVRDVIVSQRNGLGRWIAESRIDDGVGGSWRTVADSCDSTIVAIQTGVSEARWQLDYIMDVKAPASEHLTQMLVTFRANVFQADGLIKITQQIAGASVRSFESRMDESLTGRRNILVAEDAGPAGGVSSLVTGSTDWSDRPTVIRGRYTDRNLAYRQRVFDVRNLYSPCAVVSGTFTGGEIIKGGTTGSLAYFIAAIGNKIYYVQRSGAVALAAGEVVTGQTSGASVYLTGAVVTEEVPERALEFNGYGITRRTQMCREMRFHLNTALLAPVIGSWGVFLGDLDLLPNDIVDVSADVPAYVNKKFLVMRLTYGMDGKGRIEAREYNADVYADNIDVANIDSLSFQPGGVLPPGIRIPSDGATPAPVSAGTGSGGVTSGTNSSTVTGTVTGSTTKPTTTWSIFGNKK